MYTVEDVWDELNQFKEASLNGSIQECANYIPIRLVTIIEQFFRVMIVDGRISGRHDTNPPISVSILVDVFEYHAKRLPRDPDFNYGELIRKFCAGDKMGLKYEPKHNNIRFPKDRDGVIDDLVLYVLNGRDETVSKWIDAQIQSFQNVKAIKDYVGDFLDAKAIVRDYIRLFDTRHSLVHSLNSGEFDIKHYFDLVERLFEVVERENPRHVQGSTGV